MVFEYKKNEQGHYVCGICNVVKEKQNTMHYHLQRHEGAATYECDKCDKKFYQKYTLDTHMKLVHEKKDPTIKCPFDSCTETFHKKEYCRVHIARNHLKKLLEPWIVKKDTTYSCGSCNKECKSYPSILYHVMDHAKESTDTVLRAKLAII
jgi:hypothetical protein